jgi:hypothetical protein
MCARKRANKRLFVFVIDIDHDIITCTIQIEFRPSSYASRSVAAPTYEIANPSKIKIHKPGLFERRKQKQIQVNTTQNNQSLGDRADQTQKPEKKFRFIALY